MISQGQPNLALSATVTSVVGTILGFIPGLLTLILSPGFSRSQRELFTATVDLLTNNQVGRMSNMN